MIKSIWGGFDFLFQLLYKTILFRFRSPYVFGFNAINERLFFETPTEISGFFSNINGIYMYTEMRDVFKTSTYVI